MRSRYTAFVRGDIDHIENSHGSASPDRFDRASAEAMWRSVEWVGLEIYDTVDGGETDDTGIVEFGVSFKKDGVAQLHHERSTFTREDGRWAYIDGKIDPKGQPVKVQKQGRNDPCACGSGKKFKKCCGA